MITLLASIAGFVTAIIPDIFKLFVDRNDKQHELAIMDRQIRIKEQGLDQQLEEVRLGVEAAEIKALYGTFKSGIIWADALNASVRPVLAYAFFGLYALVKYLQFKILIALNNTQMIADLLWTIEDQAIFASIISFYFGQRAIAKRMRRK